MSGLLIIETEKFLGALSRLKPVAPRKRKSVGTRISKKIIEDDFYISFLFGEAVFSSHGVQTKCEVESAKWQGYISTNFQAILTFLKVKPTGKTVSISFLGNQLKIEGFSMPCKWAPVPDWIGQISADALLHSEQESGEDHHLFCPRCGKKQGIELDTSPNTQLELSPAYKINILPNRKCKSCNHSWLEITNNNEEQPWL